MFCFLSTTPLKLVAVLCCNNYPDFWIHSFFFWSCVLLITRVFFFLRVSQLQVEHDWSAKPAKVGFHRLLWRVKIPFQAAVISKMKVGLCWNMRWTCIKTKSERERCILTWKQKWYARIPSNDSSVFEENHSNPEDSMVKQVPIPKDRHCATGTGE